MRAAQLQLMHRGAGISTHRHSALAFSRWREVRIERRERQRKHLASLRASLARTGGARKRAWLSWLATTRRLKKCPPVVTGMPTSELARSWRAWAEFALIQAGLRYRLSKLANCQVAHALSSWRATLAEHTLQLRLIRLCKCTLVDRQASLALACWREECWLRRRMQQSAHVAGAVRYWSKRLLFHGASQPSLSRQVY